MCAVCGHFRRAVTHLSCKPVYILLVLTRRLTRFLLLPCRPLTQSCCYCEPHTTALHSLCKWMLSYLGFGRGGALILRAGRSIVARHFDRFANFLFFLFSRSVSWRTVDIHTHTGKGATAEGRVSVEEGQAGHTGMTSHGNPAGDAGHFNSTAAHRFSSSLRDAASSLE